MEFKISTVVACQWRNVKLQLLPELQSSSNQVVERLRSSLKWLCCRTLYTDRGYTYIDLALTLVNRTYVGSLSIRCGFENCNVVSTKCKAYCLKKWCNKKQHKTANEDNEKPSYFLLLSPLHTAFRIATRSKLRPFMLHEICVAPSSTRWSNGHSHWQ